MIRTRQAPKEPVTSWGIVDPTSENDRMRRLASFWAFSIAVGTWFALP